MLQDSDLRAFHVAFEASDEPGISSQPPDNILSKDDGLFFHEVYRLVCSLQIAAILGEVSQREVKVAQVILNNVRRIRCAPLSDQNAWSQAIAWGLTQSEVTEEIESGTTSFFERERNVGEACLRLKKRGYKVEVGAYGPQIDEKSRRDLVSHAFTFINLLGGYETAAEILRYLRDADLYHDGLWLFGEVGLNIYDDKRPMIPVGWLFSLALCRLGVRGSARKPKVPWKSLIDLATDFAAVHDCQRYSMFEDIDLHPSQFHRTVLTSTLWRELFALPQMPPTALRQVLKTLANLTEEMEIKFNDFSLRQLVNEILGIIDKAADDRLTIHNLVEIERSFPLLYSLVGGPAKAVNAGYGDPLASDKRTQDHTVLYAYGNDHIVIMPRSFLAIAACNFVFETILSKLEKNIAASLIGKSLECAVADACKGKSSKIFAGKEYHIGKKRFEFDVATRDNDQITLIETKGKVLTSKSRSGDMFAFFDDYTKSFLSMLSQLVRHEIHVREGRTPLNIDGEAADELRPPKIAISPLSYGPVCDKMLSGSLIRSMVGAELFSIDQDENHREIVKEFNSSTRALVEDIVSVAPKRDELVNLFPYFKDVFWLDLGQLLYILDRANTVWDAFTPLRNITFSSRDFWTELAHADRGKLTDKIWRQVT